jgi:branched-chain amino acid aminotransferase
MFPLAYFKGQWISSAELQIPITDLGFLQGVTVVERLRTFGHRPFRLEAHLRRLSRSLEIVGLAVEPVVNQLHGIIEQLLSKNEPLLQDGEDWFIVVLVTPGPALDASNPTLCVYGGPLSYGDWAYGNWVNHYNEGVEVVLSSVRQIPPNCLPSELKCRSRMHYYLADRQAEACCPGARAILLDQSGYLAEASTANIVAYYKDRGLVTPRLQNVLPGISLEVLFELAAGLNIPCHREDILPARFAQADEAFLTSTSVCMLPIVKQDGHLLGVGTPGPVFRQLLQTWSDLVGTDVAGQAEKWASGDG